MASELEARAASAMDNETESPLSRALQSKDVQERGIEKSFLKYKRVWLVPEVSTVENFRSDYKVN